MLKFEHFVLNLFFLSLSSSHLVICAFYFSWRIWMPALELTWVKRSHSRSAVASHHHLPGENCHSFKLPAANCSADGSLTWFPQTHQVQSKHVNICLSSTPAPLTSLTLPSNQGPAPPQHCILTAVWFGFKYQSVQSLGHAVQLKKETGPNGNEGRRMTSGQGLEQAS